MKIDADPQQVVKILTGKIASLSEESAFYLAALTEAQGKIKELEEKLNTKK